MTHTTTQPTDSSGNPVCSWCGQAVTADQMEDGNHRTQHEACFDTAHADEDFEDFSCQCPDPACQ